MAKVVDDARTLLPNGKEIRRLRKLKGMRQGDLASAAGLSLRNIQSLEAGEPKSVHTIKRVAEALETDCEKLIAPDSPQNKRAAARLGKVKVTTEKNFSELKGETLDDFVLQTAEALRRGCKIFVYVIEPGSAILTLGIEHRDIVRLVRAFARGRLRPLAVSAIEVPRAALDAATRSVPGWMTTFFSTIRRHPLLTITATTGLGIAGVLLFPSFAGGLIVGGPLTYIMIAAMAHFTRLGSAPAWYSDIEPVSLTDLAVKPPSTADILAAARGTSAAPPIAAPTPHVPNTGR